MCIVYLMYQTIVIKHDSLQISSVLIAKLQKKVLRFTVKLCNNTDYLQAFLFIVKTEVKGNGIAVF